MQIKQTNLNMNLDTAKLEPPAVSEEMIKFKQELELEILSCIGVPNQIGLPAGLLLENEKEFSGCTRLENDTAQVERPLPIFNSEPEEFKSEVPENGPARIDFVGYSGGTVDLSDYGFDAPAVYNIENMITKNTVPMLYRHRREVGHTVEIRKPGNEKITGRGLLSIPNEQSTEIREGMKNGFPYQASMGVDALKKNINFVPQGKSTKVNGRTFQGPVYVINNGRLSEMTVTVQARDPETSFKFLNEADRITLKNQKPDGTSGEEGAQNTGNTTGDAPAAPATPPTPPAPNQNPGWSNSGPGPASSSGQPVQQPAQDGNQQPSQPVQGDQRLNNSQQQQGGNTFHGDYGTNNPQVKLGQMLGRFTRLCNQYPEDTDLIEKSFDEGWDETRLNNEIRLRQLDRGIVPLPSPGMSGQQNQQVRFQNETVCRLAMTFNTNPEFLEKKFGKETTGRAFDMPMLGIQETAVRIANMHGGRFDGYSDMDAVASYLKNRHMAMRFNNSVGFSSISLPNILESVSQIQMEERWELDPPFAPRFLQEGSNKDFRPTQKMRIQAGEPWEKVGDDGTIKHTTAGTEHFYTTTLDTVGQLLAVTRQILINDDMDVMRDLMDAMLEGAMMIPDIKLGTLLFKAAAAGTFWVDTDNSHTARALTKENLSAAMTDLMTYDETRGGFQWKNMVNDRFTLVIGPTLQETAWDILKQEFYVSNTTANTLQGQRNFWYNKLDQAVFPQMSNTSLFGSGTFVDDGTWFLWPSSKRFSPYIITYLRGRRRPTIESIDLPENILGSGVRGYWDVEVNERERTMIDRNNG